MKLDNAPIIPLHYLSDSHKLSNILVGIKGKGDVAEAVDVAWYAIWTDVLELSLNFKK